MKYSPEYVAESCFSRWWIAGRLLMLVVMLLAACTSSSEPESEPESAGMPIAFRGSKVVPSRGNDLSDRYDNFMVRAVKTMPDASTQPVIPGYKVLYNNEWYYEGIEEQYLKYWDLSAASYAFAAVTPVPDNSESASVGFKSTVVNLGDEIAITNIHGNLSTGNYTNSTQAPEWMVAKTDRYRASLTDIDMIDNTVTMPVLTAFTDKVPLVFHPVMAKVDFVAYARGNIIVQNFKVTVADGQPITNRGDYSTDGGWTNRTVDTGDYPLTFGEYTYTDGKVLSTDPKAPTLLASHVQIPQSWAETGRKFHVTVTTKTGDTYDADILITSAINDGNEWKQAWHYTYVLYINSDEGSSEVILVDVNMDEWHWKEGNSHQEIQTNW